MKTLDLYIGRVLASTTFITLSVFVSLSGIIKFVEQMRAVGRGSYELGHAALFVFYAIPRDVEIFFPMAALIGGLIGLGTMASNSELVVMQAAGLSRLQIIKSVMKTSVVLILCSMAIGEWFAPVGEAKAREIRAQAISGGSLISSDSGVWAKDGDFFVHIGEVESKGSLTNIQIYRFNDELKLSSWTSAKSANYHDKQWLLTEVVNTEVTDKKIIKTEQETQTWPSSLTPDKLGVVTVKPESLSIMGLIDYLDYLEANEQNPNRYLLAFWRKVTQPFTVAVMLLLALSYIFGPLRSMSMGARILMGVVTGLVFNIVNQTAGSLSLVYQVPPVIGAILPSLLTVGVAMYFINKPRT